MTKKKLHHGGKACDLEYSTRREVVYCLGRVSVEKELLLICRFYSRNWLIQLMCSGRRKISDGGHIEIRCPIPENVANWRLLFEFTNKYAIESVGRLQN